MSEPPKPRSVRNNAPFLSLCPLMVTRTIQRRAPERINKKAKPLPVAVTTRPEVLHQLLCQLAVDEGHRKTTTFQTTQDGRAGITE